jgi:GTPase SAR1 family protein
MTLELSAAAILGLFSKPKTLTPNSGSILSRFKPAADAAAHDSDAYEIIVDGIWSLMNEANDKESAVALCNDGAVELAVHVLQLFLDDADNHDRLVCGAVGVLYNLSRSLPRKRPVRLKMMDAEAFTLLPRLHVCPIGHIRLCATLVSSHLTMAGLPREYRLPIQPESIRLLVSALRDAIDGVPSHGGYWCVEEIFSALQSLCANADNRRRFLQEGGGELVLQCLDALGPNCDSSLNEVPGDDINVIMMVTAKLANDTSFRALCTPQTVELLTSYITNSDSSTKCAALSALAHFGSGDVSINDAFAQACAVGSARWNRSQLSLVGKGRAGKTAFARALLQKPFVHTESTVGMEGMTCEVSSVASGKVWWQEDGSAASSTTELERLQAQLTASFTKGAAFDSVSILDEVESSEASNSFNFLDANITSNSPTSQPNSALLSQPHHVGHSSSHPNKLNQELFLESLHDDEADDNVVFEMWDYGGQDVFYAMFHLFITPHGVFTVLFNMEEILESPVLRSQNLAFIDFWLNSIFMHTAREGSCAPIILVGTHKDVVASPLEHCFVSWLLQERFSSHVAWSSVQECTGSTHFSNRGVITACFDSLDSAGTGSITTQQIKKVIPSSIPEALMLSFIRNISHDCTVVHRDAFCDRLSQNMHFFPVDNTRAHRDPMIPVFLSTVESVVRQSDYIRQSVPVAWIKCLDAMRMSSSQVLDQHTHTHTRTRTHARARTHTHTHTHKHTHTHTQTHTNTHTHTGVEIV